jgi:hypothetical protein
MHDILFMFFVGRDTIDCTQPAATRANGAMA